MLKAYFMFDNHTFASLTGDDRDTLIQQAVDLFTKDGWGSLFVRDQMDGEMASLTLNGHGRVPKAEIASWAEAFLAERKFLRLLVA